MDQGPKSKRETCPKDTANLLSVVTFFYALKIFIKGFKKELEEDDIYAVMKKLNSKTLGDRLENEWYSSKSNNKKMAFARCLLFCFGLKFFLYGCFDLFTSVVFSLTMPNATGRLVAYFSEDKEMTLQDACFYAAVIVLTTIMDIFFLNAYTLLMFELATSVRIAFCSMLYRKCLRLSPAAFSEISTGKIITLMTKDVQVLHTFVLNGCNAWLAIVHIFSVTTIMSIRIGIAALAGVGSFLLVIPLEIYLGKKAAAMRLESSKRTDVRLQKTQEALSAIKIIKMYTWEPFFTRKISDARKAEIVKLRIMNYLRALTMCVSLLGSYLSFYIMLITFIKYGNNVTAENIFYTIGLYQGLRHFISQALPLGILYLAEIAPSITRIEALMDAEELKNQEVERNITDELKIELQTVASRIRDKTLISDVSCIVDKGLTILTGSLGSGKTSLLKVIMKEYPLTEGLLKINGTFSYASQDPWLFPASIKNNILFGEKFNEVRYQRVLDVCALNYDLKLMVNADETIVEDRGMNLSKGQQARINLARAIYRDSDIYLLDDCLAALDVTVQSHILQKCVVEFLKNKICLLVSHNMKTFREAQQILIMENGTLKSISKMDKLLENEVITNYCIQQERNIDYNIEEKQEKEPNEHAKLLECILTARNVYHEFKKQGGVQLTIYWRYIKFGGPIFVLIFILGLSLGEQFSISYLDKILSNWVDSLNNVTKYIQNNDTDSSGYSEAVDEGKSYLDLYFIMLMVAHFAVLFRSAVFIFLISRISVNIHKETIVKVMNATMEFFDGTFVGNILNRLSRDMSIIDEELPLVVSECLRAVCQIVGVFGLVATVDAIYILPSIIIFFLMLLMRYIYIPTGRSLKRMDSATRSPVIGHLNATIEGLTTIRAYGKQDMVKEEFDRHQDLNTSAYHLSAITGKAFAISLNILSLFYTCFMLTHLLFFSDKHGGDAGLVLTQASGLTNLLQFGMLQFAFLENQMTSVERVLEYTNVKQEKITGNKLDDWPNQGSIIYQDVSLTYERTEETVLSDINLHIPPKSKIGIVGRTGAGKSSIVGTLFRLYDINGSITIDEIETNKLDASFLRSSLSIIPQDPMIFRGSIRDNIDPFGRYSDNQIWDVLETIKLRDQVKDLTTEVNENVAQFSAGQRQLISLARVLLQKNKIIVLDEATANMDPETDTLMQEIIKDRFKDCTVLIIAHKLDSVMDSDRIMVLDSGRVVEFDTPTALMEDTNSRFYSMTDI